MVNLIWATRGRSWGFRFLLDGGLADPLASYEQAFAGLEDRDTVCRLTGGRLALRFPDPLDRKDVGGRTIPHDFVLLGSAAPLIDSVDEGVRRIWPLVADVFARVWQDGLPPPVGSIRYE
jgi:hypothetical protein